MACENKAQLSLEYLLFIAAVITLIVVISLFIKGSLLRQWLGMSSEYTNQSLNRTT